MSGAWLVSALDCQSRGPRFKSARAEIWFEISAPPAPPSQLSYDEYTDRTRSLGRQDGEGENWPPLSYAEAKKRKSLTLHPHGCPTPARGYSSLLYMSRAWPPPFHEKECNQQIIWNIIWLLEFCRETETTPTIHNSWTMQGLWKQWRDEQSFNFRWEAPTQFQWQVT